MFSGYVSLDVSPQIWILSGWKLGIQPGPRRSTMNDPRIDLPSGYLT